jgi:hypothetical protein
MKKALVLIAWLILTTLAIAATTTTYYGLYKPATGDKNWGTQINQNFDTIDTALNGKADSSSVTASLSLKLDASEVGVPDGVASLNSSGKVPDSQLPASLSGALVYKGTLDASGGTYPASPDQGDYYIISVEGTIETVDYTVGDWATYNGSDWSKVDNTQAVVSVNGVDGVVVLDTGDISEATDANYVSDAQLVVIGNTSGTNTGDQDLSSYAPKANPTFTGTVTGTFAGNVTGNVTGNLTGNVTGNVTGTSGSTTGNAATATALAANPTDCAAGQYATTIAANGNLTCSTPPGSISGLTTNYLTKASSATAIANSSILDNGSAISTSLNITAPTFIGALTGNASTATALAANGTNCSSGQAAQGVDASGNAESCFAPGGWSTDNSTKTTTTYKVGVGVASPTKELEVDGTLSADNYISTSVDSTIYKSTSMIGLSKFGTYTTSIEGVTAGTSTPVVGSAILAVDGSIYTTTGSIGVMTASPSVALDVRGQAKAYTLNPTAYPALTAASYSLTPAILATADVFLANTTSNAVSVTLYDTVADNGIPTADVGRTIVFYLQTIDASNDTLTVGADSDLTLTTVQAIAAGGLVVEDVGDHIDCTVLTTDHIVCTTFEAD